MKRIFIIAISLCISYIVLAPSCVLASQKLPARLSTDSLMKESERYLEKGDYKNALICLSVVAGRYEQGVPERETRMIIDANLNLSSLYSFYYFDNSKAYEATLLADEIAKKTGLRNARIFFNLGAITQTLGEQAEDSTLLRQAYGYFSRCIEMQLDSTDHQLLDEAMCNYLILGHNIGVNPSGGNLWRRYVKGSRGAEEYIFKYNRLVNDAYVAQRNRHYGYAVAAVDSQLNLLSRYPNAERFKLLSHLIKSEMLMESGASCGEVESAVEAMLEMATRVDAKDAKMLAYKLLWNNYRSGRCADPGKAVYYVEKYLELKDSLQSYQQAMSLSSIEAAREISAVNDRMATAQRISRMKTMGLWLVALLCVIVTIFLLILRQRNKKLSATNKILYEKTVAALRQEEMQRECDNNKDKGSEEDGGRERMDAGLEITEEKKSLLNSVREVMSGNPEIYSLDFTITRFSEIIGEPQRTISQVINELTGSNFVTLLNEYRVKEACRRLGNDKAYGQMTIEAVANSVGFRARSSFIAAFKKFTGLTPSQYQKMSRENTMESSGE